MTATSYNINLDMIADSLRDVMGTFNFLAFQIPVKVSTTIAKPIKNIIPDIGKKKEPTTAKSCTIDFWIEVNKMVNCVFMGLGLQGHLKG